MLWFTHMSLNLNNFLKTQKEVAEKKQRKHTVACENTTFGADAMSQARVLSERD